MPIASIFRTKHGEYPEYHTSLDNFNVVTKKGLMGGYKIVKKAIDIIMKNYIPKSTFLCEPQMSKRGLYPSLSKFVRSNYNLPSRHLLNFLQYADGTNDLNDISKYIKFSFEKTYRIFKLMLKSKLIKL